MLSSVIAQNKSYLSVQVTWRLTDHGVFTFALVSLGLRLIDSNNWSHVISNISQYHGFYRFEHLQPCGQYLLNITLHNKYKQTESRAVVFWSAATNSSGIKFKFVKSNLVPRVLRLFGQRLVTRRNSWGTARFLR